MSNRTIRNLAVVLFALVAVVIGLELSDDSGTSTTGAGDRLFSELREQINQLDRVTIDRPQAETGVEQTIIAKTDAGWIVETRDGYSADVGKVREVLLALADARILEEKTSNPERYEALGLRDPEAEGSRGVRLTGGGGDVEFSVILGDSNQGSNRYVRIAGQDTSVLIDQNPALPEQAGGWLQSDLVDIATSDVREVSIRHADGETLRIEKVSEDETDFTVSDLPEGRELSYPGVANSIAEALNDLTLTDVRTAVEGESDSVTEVTTFDGLRIEAAVFTDVDDGAGWIALAADSELANGESDDSASGNGESDNGEVDTSDSEKTDSAEARAATLNERLAGRQFRIPDAKLSQLTRRWEDILQALPDDSEEDAE